MCKNRKSGVTMNSLFIRSGHNELERRSHKVICAMRIAIVLLMIFTPLTGCVTINAVNSEWTVDKACKTIVEASLSGRRQVNGQPMSDMSISCDKNSFTAYIWSGSTSQTTNKTYYSESFTITTYYTPYTFKVSDIEKIYTKPNSTKCGLSIIPGIIGFMCWGKRYLCVKMKNGDDIIFEWSDSNVGIGRYWENVGNAIDFLRQDYESRH
jgi:hypothetical protein